jgi:hypothetical protein
MCLFRKCQLRGLRSRQKRSLLFVNEYFGGKRNEASGTFWTDTKYERGSSELFSIKFDENSCFLLIVGLHNRLLLKPEFDEVNDAGKNIFIWTEKRD